MAFELRAEDIRAARALLQWSQADLAKAANIGESILAGYEDGSGEPTAANLAEMKHALEVAGVAFTPDGPTLMYQLSLYMLTEVGGMEMWLRYAREGLPMIQALLEIFGTPEADDYQLDSEQCATLELKENVRLLVERHGKSAPQLNKLKKKIHDLGDGELFLLLPSQPATTADKLAFERHLYRLNHPDEETDDAAVDSLFGPLLANYEMEAPRADCPTMIGAGRRPRQCRFCGGTKASGATFKSAAHVIATALGNDHLKSKEECDGCNQYFGRETEPSLIAMLDMQRVFLGTQGRGKNDGRPELQFGAGTIAHDGKAVLIDAKAGTRKVGDMFEVELGKGAPLVPSAVYRTLVKMVLSVIDPTELAHLGDTLTWVRRGQAPEGRALPTIATSIVYLAPDPSAQIVAYVRKAPHPRLPHIVGEFRLGCFIHVFAVPFSKADTWDLVGFFDDADFRDIFKHYSAAAQWQQRDLSGNQRINLTPKLRFVPGTP